MPRLPCECGICVLFGFDGEATFHPRQLALRATADVVVGDGLADGVVCLAVGVFGDEPVRDFGEQGFEWNAVAALPLRVQVLRQCMETRIRRFIRRVHNQRQGLREAA